MRLLRAPNCITEIIAGLFRPFSFIHTADIHLGSMQYGLEERREDFANAFVHVVDNAIELKVKFVVIAGDLFDNPRPSSSTLTFVIAQLKRLREHGIPVLAVNGSHDTAQMPETSILTPLDKADLLHFLPLYGSEGWSNHECYVYGLFNYSSRLRVLRELLDYIKEHPPKPNKPFNICVLHQGLEWPGISSLFTVEIRPEELPEGFQYYAAGHLHHHAVLRLADSGSMFVYPGATETKEVRESGEKKGFCYVEVNSPENSEIEFREIPVRRFVKATIRCNDLTPSEITSKVMQRIRGMETEGSVVAVTLEGVLPPGSKRFQIDVNSIFAARRKALHIQLLNHLHEAELEGVPLNRDQRPRDLRERILPYMKQFLKETGHHLESHSLASGQLESRAEALWQILDIARSGKLNESQAASLSDRLTELAKNPPPNS